MFRLVSSLLIAVALLFSPLAMADGKAMAACHAPRASMDLDAHGVTTDAPPGHKERSDAKVSCTVGCAALLMVESAIGDEMPPTVAKTLASRSQLLIGIRLEGETPPPRITPEI